MAAPLLIREVQLIKPSTVFRQNKIICKYFNRNGNISYRHHFTRTFNLLIKPIQNSLAAIEKPKTFHSNSFTTKGVVATVSAVVGFAGIVRVLRDGLKVFAKESERPQCKPSRQINVPSDTSGLKLTLYQYQTCPFCCKVRAALDFYGFSYDVIEVNSVTKKQLKWSEYQKVPVLIIGSNNGTKHEVQLNDSSVIVSILESYLQDSKASIDQLKSYYPCSVEKEGRRVKYNFMNKYFIMMPNTPDNLTVEERSEERKWREWADDHLVHMLSPNAYRTAGEALQAFNYFSEVGEWEQNFSALERYMVIYVGASVMYIMGKFLKNKYKLNDDVRLSLYQACNEWVKAVGKNRPFMGGSVPNLADLAVYGVLNSIEGCIAFQDTLKNTNIGPWYKRMKEATQTHLGAIRLKAPPS